jgi:hypothetical protein
MRFYVAYNIQDDFPGAEIHDDVLEVFNSEKDFLLTLKNYVRYARFLALCNDPGRLEENPEEEGVYRKYISMIDEILQNGKPGRSFYEEDFEAYDLTVTISKATADFMIYFRYVCAMLTRKKRSEEDECGDAVPEDGSDDGSVTADDRDPLYAYCMRIKKSGDKPDPDVFAEKMENYMAVINHDANYLGTVPKMDDSDDTFLAARIDESRATRRIQAEKRKKYGTISIWDSNLCIIVMMPALYPSSSLVLQ